MKYFYCNISLFNKEYLRHTFYLFIKIYTFINEKTIYIYYYFNISLLNKKDYYEKINTFLNKNNLRNIYIVIFHC